MLHYLLNTTAIWAIGLLVFDVFLRRESYHAYNRFYLLSALLLGLVVPLCYVPLGNGVAYTAAVPQHVAAAAIGHPLAIHTIAAPVAAFSWLFLLQVIYIAGAAMAGVLLLADTLKLAGYYRKGAKMREGIWLVVATGRAHAPFSFRYTLFISNREQYNAAEWQMIIGHEARHSALLHMADLLLVQALRVGLWFHPLVYLFNRRLLLVHEYQADTVAAARPQQYGRFLVQQSLLAAAPALAFSFNRSPIKNRLIMLTHRSPGTAKGKMLLLFPLTVLCFSCFSRHEPVHNFEQQGALTVRKGNTIALSRETTDTSVVEDPISGKRDTTFVTLMSGPVKLNGKPIQEATINNNTGIKPGGIMNGTGQYFIYLIKQLTPVLQKLDDGRYRISPDYSVIDEHGMLAGYKFTGVYKSPDGSGTAIITPIDTALQREINNATVQALEQCPKMQQVVVNGQPVPYTTGSLYIYVKQHQVNAM